LQSLAYISPTQGEFGGLDDSDDDEEGGNYVINVRTALLEAKKGAITAIGEIGQHCGAAFAPFLEKTIPLLQKAAGNFHPLIKTEVADSLPSMVMPVVYGEHGGTITWTKGDISGASPIGAQTTAIVNVVLKELMTLMKDDDKETVGKACESVQNIIEVCGPHALVPVANECLETVHALLTKTAPCQLSEDAEYYDDEDDDHDSFMVQVCDLVGSFGRVMGSHFAQYLDNFLPAICSFAKSSRPASDRSMAMGCLGEVAQELGDSVREYWKGIFLPSILAGLGDSDNNVKRNAAFCAGVSCEGLGDYVAADYGTILASVAPLFNIDQSESDTSAAAVDNACACVSRMIMACPNNVPVGQVLPAILSKLPLKSDMTENETVYKCLLGLLQMNHNDAIAVKAEIKRVFTEATSEGSKVDDETKQKLLLALPAM
jgi:hypothetical protein